MLSFSRIVVVFVSIVLLAIGCVGQSKNSPELSVAGVKLGDRESAKKFLDGYQPRTDEGTCSYYFYSSRGTVVMKLTAASCEDKYMITAIEAFAVDETYTKRHFVADKLGHFVTENGIFIGFRQSGGGLAIALIVGVPNLSRSNMIGPKDVVKIKGEPATRNKDGKVETMTYRIDDVAVGEGKYDYSSRFEFYGKELTKFEIKIDSPKHADSAKVKQ
ncbi:MAG TPA: hypothetical protein PKA82_13860 [Pyrinomonadaceae bacterium]|nr:hypothetical protein [Pyrinomonadaceae bacterium]